jgi:hypothetical protein
VVPVTIVHDARSLWLLRRREIIGASDVAAILGVDKHRSNLDVYCEKLGLGEQAEVAAMLRGRIYQDAIATDYQQQTGRAVEIGDPYEIHIHPSVSWIGSTFDARTQCDAQWISLELKWALGSGYEWKDEPPRAYIVQAQIQIQCNDGARVGALAGLVGPGPLSCVDLERDDEFFDLAYPVLERFRWHVENKVPPEPESGLALPALKRIWPGADGRTLELPQALPLGHRFKEHWTDCQPQVGCGEETDDGRCDQPEASHYDPNDPQRRADALERNKSESKRLADQADEDQAVLRHALGGAQWGRLPDGSLIERQKTAHRDVIKRIWPKRGRG